MCFFQNNCNLSSHEALIPEACLVNSWNAVPMRKICHILAFGKEEAYIFCWLSWVGFFASLWPLVDESLSSCTASSLPPLCSSDLVHPIRVECSPSCNNMRLLALCRSLFSLEADGYCAFQSSNGVSHWTAWPWLLGLPKYCQKYFFVADVAERYKS